MRSEQVWHYIIWLTARIKSMGILNHDYLMRKGHALMNANSILLYFMLSSISLMIEKAYGEVKDDSIIAVASIFPPFQYLDKGNLKGISIDVIEAVSQATGLVIEYRVIPWKRAYKYTLSKPNTFIMAISRIPEREPFFKWVGPLYNTQIKLYRLASRDDILIEDLSDAKQFRIGTVRGYASESYLLSRDFKLNVQIFSDATTEYNVKKLLMGRIDLLVSTNLTLSYLVKIENIDVNLITDAFKLGDPIKDYFGFNLNTSDKVITTFQSAFNELVKSGGYKKIVDRYLLEF